MENKDLPAFPATQSEYNREEFGLTKREYFAAMAVIGKEDDITNVQCAQVEQITGLKNINWKDIEERINAIAKYEAIVKVKKADALLTELEKK